MAAHYVNDVLVAVDARRVDARPGGDEAPPIPMRCQGCGDDIAEGSPFFERVADGCPFCRSCAVENAAGDDPDEMRTGEWVEASSAEPLLPADHPLATRPRRDDAVGLVREPFVPSARAAAETVAEMARLRCKTIVRPAIYLAEARAAMADGRPGFLRDGANGLCVVQDVREIGDDKIEIDLSPFASTPIEEHAARELERLLPGLAHDIEMVTELRHESQRSSPIQRLARAAELLTRDRERLTKRVAELKVRNRWLTEEHDAAQVTHAANRARVAELEAAGRVTASLAKDFAAQAAAEQSIRAWLRAHGHDTDRPWDEVVIGLLSAPLVGSVAGLDHLIRVIVSDARDWSTNRTDAWIYGAIVGWGDALAEVAERNGWTEETTRRLESTASLIRSALAPSPMGAIVAEVVAVRLRLRVDHDERLSDIARLTDTDGSGVRRAYVAIAAEALAGILACDAAKGGACG